MAHEIGREPDRTEPWPDASTDPRNESVRIVLASQHLLTVVAMRRLILGHAAAEKNDQTVWMLSHFISALPTKGAPPNVQFR
jgi:hypothetical protein